MAYGNIGATPFGSNQQRVARYLIEHRRREITHMRTARGFTLIEIMVATAIVAIAATFAVPNIVGWRAKQRFLSAASDVYEAVKVARAAAIKQNTNAIVQFDTANRRFTVFMDLDGDQNQDAGESTIHSASYRNDITLDTGGLTNNRLAFDGRGLVANPPLPPQNGIRLSHANYGQRTIQVTVTGNSRVQ
jgi:prepilin-type N-terminal cleavage/methylation domain-containing protein